MGAIGSPETSVLNRITQRNNPEDGTIPFNCGGSLRSRNVYVRACVRDIALVIRHAKRYSLLFSHLRPVWLYHIFPHYLLNGMIFG